MKWFKGTIPEAITTSKAKKAVFVVFIEGEDDTSKDVARTLDTADVSSRLESEKFVAIKLQSNSENYTFFAQIYQLVPVPSIFFIGDNGTPLEIIGNSLPAAELASKIDSILEKAHPQAKNASTNLIEAEQGQCSNSDQDGSNVQCNINSAATDSSQAAKETNSNNAAGSSLPSSTEDQNAASAEDNSKSEISQEEKVRRARELIALQNKKKMEEEEKKEREREIERRRTGKDLQKLRQQQQDREIREAQQERLREKAAEAAAREKIRKQIAEDKLERKRKHEMHLQEKNDQQQKKLQEKAQAQAASVNMSKARIQFKLPTGNNITGTFEATDTLGHLRTYVSQNAQLPFRQFSMSSFFPRKDFTPSDDAKTLLELDLVPSSTILILPVKSNIPTSVIKSTDGAGIFSHFFWTLFAPVVSIYNYIMGYFAGRPRAGDSGSNNENRNSGNSDNSGIAENASASFDRLANLGMRRLGNQGATKIKARGNVHTLHSGDNDNDENNTWNGNSTQQM